MKDLLENYDVELSLVKTIQQVSQDLNKNILFEIDDNLVREHDGNLTEENLFDPQGENFHCGLIFLENGDVYYTEQRGEGKPTTYQNVTSELSSLVNSSSIDEYLRDCITISMNDGEDCSLTSI